MVLVVDAAYELSAVGAWRPERAVPRLLGVMVVEGIVAVPTVFEPPSPTPPGRPPPHRSTNRTRKTAVESASTMMRASSGVRTLGVQPSSDAARDASPISELTSLGRR